MRVAVVVEEDLNMPCGSCDRARAKQAALIQKQREEQDKIDSTIAATKTRAILVCGLEACGDKELMTILKNIGVDCDDTDAQKWDMMRLNASVYKVIALRRSYPHGKLNDITNQVNRLKATYDKVIVLSLWRSHYPNYKAAIDKRHILSEDERLKQIKEYFAELSKIDVPIYNVTYESLSEVNTIRWLHKISLGLEMPKNFASGFKSQNYRY